MMRCALRGLAIILLDVALVVYSAVGVVAADIRIVDEKSPGAVGIVIEGRIYPGDAAKFLQVVQDAVNKGFAETGNVYLASPGGRADEALEIAAALNTLGLNTVAPQQVEGRNRCAVKLNSATNCLCLSGCGIMFAAGVIRTGSAVGFHPVSMRCIRDQRMSKDCGGSEKGWNDFVAEFFIDHLSAPAEFVTRVLGTSSDKMWDLTPQEVELYLPAVSPSAQFLLESTCSSTVVALGERGVSEIIRSVPEYNNYVVSVSGRDCLTRWRSRVIAQAAMGSR